MRLPHPDTFRRIHLDSCESTQDVALAYVREAELVSLVSTFHQTRGRGRGDRVWLTPPGEALTFSAIQWPYADYTAIPYLGMAWAIAVATVCDAQLQWPNDVVIEGKKVCGILTEVVRDPGGRKVAVVGIGVNVSQSEFPDEIAHRATSLKLAGRSAPQPEPLLAAILSEVEGIPEPDGWHRISELWMARDATKGKKLFIPNSGHVIADTVDDNGNLVAHSSDGPHSRIVTSIGEVVYESSK